MDLGKHCLRVSSEVSRQRSKGRVMIADDELHAVEIAILRALALQLRKVCRTRPHATFATFIYADRDHLAVRPEAEWSPLSRRLSFIFRVLVICRLRQTVASCTRPRLRAMIFHRSVAHFRATSFFTSS